MNKEALLHQLEFAVTNNDKKLFTKTIYDLPTDVITGFTEEEFSRIIYLAHQFSSQKMDKLFNIIEIKGSFFLKNALKESNELNNFLLSKFYYSLCISLSETSKEKAKRVLINNAVACCKLAEMGVNKRKNLETAVSLYCKAREIIPKKSAAYSIVLMDEGYARKTLAEMDVDIRKNIEAVVSLYNGAQEILPQTSVFYAIALVNEGNARQILAQMDIDRKENLETAVRLYGAAQEIFSKTSADYARALVNEGNARQILAQMGVDSRNNLETAVRLYGAAQEIFSKTSADYARALVNEGNARQILAQMGIDSRNNLETAVRLYGAAQEIFSKTSADYSRALMNEGNTRSRLAQMGVDSRKNLETAVRLYCEFKELFPKKNSDYALALMNEGSARSRLAELGVDSRKNLETAIRFYGTAQELFTKTSTNYARALMNEGSTRQILAGMGVDSRANLETAVRLYGTAKEILSQTSADYARALMNEGSARSRLAELGVDSRKNLETAICFYRTAQELFTKTSASYAFALMNEGSARSRLDEMEIDSTENFERSKELYVESISILEKLGDGWAYSIALLNLNSLLKDNFYKTGNKKNLEEWGKNLGDIEEKIKNRDIRYKKKLMSRIHEIRASLLEFEGKSGINKASREYGEAYKLSKDTFYNFMDEFCQARADNKSFCELVSDWREREKKDIFLDYYDYAVFECHLENALRKSIVRKNELELARRKLEEIGNRTQIKIIKDRVSAYVFLMNSLDFCFDQGSYEEAAENVLKAYNIFLEFDDKQGCEMCECFNEALLENQNPESWRNVIQKILLSGEFASNFYRLLCNYSDRKRTSILQDLPLQILKNTTEIKETLNDLQKMLDQIRLECISIKDQIGKGFKGTDAELKQIKEKIDNSQQSLEYLVQVSNKVDGKEGECIREFASQMLEIMKKGDCEALKRFIEKIVQNSSSITEIIEAAEIPEKEKAEAKSKLADLKKIPGILKKKAKSFSVDVTKDVIVSLASGEIIKLLTPVLSTAIFGVPIPSQVVGILIEAIKNS